MTGDLHDITLLCELMQKYGLARLVVDGITLERPAHLVTIEAVEREEKKGEPAAEDEDPLDKLRKMTPDQQDAALMLTRVVP